jgi:hypothetical protein
MSILSGRNKPKNRPTEAEPENDETDGREESVNCPEINRVKGESCLQWTWRVNCVPPVKHRFGWLPQVSVRNQGLQLRRVQTHDQRNNLPGFENFELRLLKNNLKAPENIGKY